jgi:hypothetical protein
MENTIFDGGPANPIGNEPGISVRDFFASSIISGLYAAGNQGDITDCATAAYRQADEMLRVRTLEIPPVPAPEESPAQE